MKKVTRAEMYSIFEDWEKTHQNGLRKFDGLYQGGQGDHEADEGREVLSYFCPQGEAPSLVGFQI